MAYITLNNKDVINCLLSIPRTGVWHADIQVDAGDDPVIPKSVTISIDEGKSRWVGTMHRGGDAFGRLALDIVGGANGLPEVKSGQSYKFSNARAIIESILSSAGENLSIASDSTSLATVLDSWSKIEGRASSQLKAIVEALGLTWRILQDGTVWIGRESWPDVPPIDDLDVLIRNTIEGYIDVSSTQAYMILPGMTLEGEHVEYVEHKISGDRIRTRVYFE